MALATLIAGAIGALSGIEHAYWAMACAVLVLYQGFDFPRTVQRGIERLLGTGVGLVLTGAISRPIRRGCARADRDGVAVHDRVAGDAQLRGLAVVFITPAALVIGTGGRAVDDVGNLLVTRVVDTVIGVAVGMAVYAATMRRTTVRHVPEAVAAVLDDVDRTLIALATGSVTSVQAQTARRDLQQQVIALERSYAADVGSSIRSRDTAEWLWPSVAADRAGCIPDAGRVLGHRQTGRHRRRAGDGAVVVREHGLDDLRAALVDVSDGYPDEHRAGGTARVAAFPCGRGETLHDSVARRPMTGCNGKPVLRRITPPAPGYHDTPSVSTNPSISNAGNAARTRPIGTPDSSESWRGVRPSAAGSAS